MTLVIQNIYRCDSCDETPADGDKMWQVDDELVCDTCCDEKDKQE